MKMALRMYGLAYLAELHEIYVETNLLPLSLKKEPEMQPRTDLDMRIAAPGLKRMPGETPEVSPKMTDFLQLELAARPLKEAFSRKRPEAEDDSDLNTVASGAACSK